MRKELINIWGFRDNPELVFVDLDLVKGGDDAAVDVEEGVPGLIKGIGGKAVEELRGVVADAEDSFV